MTAAAASVAASIAATATAAASAAAPTWKAANSRMNEGPGFDSSLKDGARAMFYILAAKTKTNPE